MTVEMDKLVDLAKEGHVGAMRRLYDDNREKILKLAFSYTRNIHDAEEILQDTFIKAFAALKKNKLRENSRFPSWLYRICINTSLDLVKKVKSTRNEPFDETMPTHIEDLPVKDPEVEAMRIEIGERLNRSLAYLTPRQRMIFTMKHFQQLKIREIAEHLACSEGNIKQQLFRAVRRLKDDLTPWIMEAENDL